MFDQPLASRIRCINKPDSNVSGECVVYVMSRDQRVDDNHALIAAQKHAIEKSLPLIVTFCLYQSTGHRTKEQYEFMLQGLGEVENKLKEKKIAFHLLVGNPSQKLGSFFEESNPSVVFFDFNPLAGPRTLLDSLVESNPDIPMYVVDTHNMIPCWVASDKKEFSAATFRPKVHKYFGEYLIAPDDIAKHPHDFKGKTSLISGQQKAIDAILDKLVSTGISYDFKPGEHAAQKKLADFISNKLEVYAHDRNDPTKDALSGLSPYLHFGQLSSLRVALELQAVVNGAGASLHLLESKKMPQADSFSNKKVASAAALLEEMIVRKELSDNFCYYEDNYLRVAGAHDWAQETIREHDADKREHLYSKEELQNADTHDEAWNAAQRQMTSTGKMHGYMRMYWAKKVKEWTPDAQTAVDILVELNDKYHLDGGDPNGYVGIMWSVSGVHDRPWTERDVFGKIRYMNYAGLKRKFNIEAYIDLHKNNK